MTATNRVLKAALSYAESFAFGDLPATPALGLAIVACMDSRLNLFALFDLIEGDAHIMRNGGGSVTDDVIRSLALSQRLLGTRETMIVQHTNCGSLMITDESFAEEIKKETGMRLPWSAGAFSDLDDNVRMSMMRIEESPFIVHKAVRGFVYDVESGKLREVES